MGCWKVLETGQCTGMPRARPLAGKVKLVNGAEWLQHRSHTFLSLEEMEKNSKGEKCIVIGNMGVYVDDLLRVAPEKHP